MAIVDIHTHHGCPQPEGVISVSLHEAGAVEMMREHVEQLFSAGFHPWYVTAPLGAEERKLLEEAAGLPNVVAIGEAGIDLVKGAPLFVQLLNFKAHVEVSEKFGLPLVIHCVKGVDIVAGVHRDMSVTQPWCIHGFRLKPAPALQLTSRGIYLSFGERFNADTVAAIPPELILAETDESPLPISAIIDNLSAYLPDAQQRITQNTNRFLTNGSF